MGSCYYYYIISVIERGMASSEAVTVLNLLLALQSEGYVTGLSTDLPTENGVTAVVAALHGECHQSFYILYCTGTSLHEEGGTKQLLNFDQPGASSFFATGTGRQTIRSFSSNLDMGLLECMQ